MHTVFQESKREAPHWGLATRSFNTVMVFSALSRQARTMCGAAPCLLEAKDKNFGAIYGNDDEMAGGPRSRCR
jgi:hypothetical protein